MSTEQIFALGRVIERLVICTFAGISLALGWNLFRVGVVTQQSADLSAKGWRVNLKRVGPGVFFALFGSAVLALSLHSPLSLPLRPATDSVSGSQDGKKDEPTATYAHETDPEVAKSWVASINTVEYIATREKLGSQAEQQAMARAKMTLAQLRDALVIRQFGNEFFLEYQAYKKKKSVSPGTVTEKEDRRFAGIEAWMRADRIEE